MISKINMYFRVNVIEVLYSFLFLFALEIRWRVGIIPERKIPVEYPSHFKLS